MADDTDKTRADPKPVPRRAPRKTAATKTPVKPLPANANDIKVASPTGSRPKSTKAAPKSSPKPAPKPRTPKRRKPSATATSKANAKQTAKKAVDKAGGKWSTAAIAGGVAVAGVATAALLSLRGSTPKKDKPVKAGKGAHQADGTDASRSFEAGIADEGTIPE